MSDARWPNFESLTQDEIWRDFFLRAPKLASETEAQAYYAHWAPYYEKALGRIGDYVAQDNLAAIVADAVVDRDAEILDIACGTGLVGMALASRGFRRIDGVDLARHVGAGESQGLLPLADLRRRRQAAPHAARRIWRARLRGAFVDGHLGGAVVANLISAIAPGGLFVADAVSDSWRNLGIGEALEALRAQGVLASFSHQPGHFFARRVTPLTPFSSWPVNPDVRRSRIGSGRQSYRSNVARTHQSGRVGRAAPRRAAPPWRSSNSAKQVAPEPDMRASRARAGLDKRRQRLRDRRRDRFALACSRCGPGASAATTSRRLERLGEGGAPERRAGASPSAANTAGVGDRDARVDEHGGQRRASPAAGRAARRCRPSRRARGSRQTGTSAPVARAAANRRSSSGGEAVGGGERAQRRRRVARAAAEARRDRQGLRKMEAPEPQARRRARRARAPRAARDCRPSGRPRRAVGPSIVRPALRRLKRQPVADAGEGDEAVELVTAVGATAEHVQRQIDLGRGAPEPRRAHRQALAAAVLRRARRGGGRRRRWRGSSGRP